MTRSDAKFRVLVVGCTPGSFGHSLIAALRAEGTRDEPTQWEIVGADRPECGYGEGAFVQYDVTDSLTVHEGVMATVQPHHVVYAVGMNRTDNAGEGTLANSAVDHFELNVAGWLRCAEAFQMVALPGSHLVAVSSNTANVARSPSVGYGASKAAMSHTVRSLARRWKGQPIVWGVEPGLMDTKATRDAVHGRAWGDRGPAHRMPGVTNNYGLSADQVAGFVAHNMFWGGMALNGTLHRMDAGEQ